MCSISFYNLPIHFFNQDLRSVEFGTDMEKITV